jgi:hypothetical protein
MRKHTKQMKQTEREALNTFIKQIAVHVVSTHAAERMTQKDVSAREIELCLQYGEGIEIHNDAGTPRAVVRFQYGRPKVAVCVVVELLTGKIVTVWKNAGSDNHQTLNLFAYQWTVNVAILLAGLVRSF